MTLELSYTDPQLEIIDAIESGKHKFVIITKGRRFGLTKGMANAIIEWAIQGEPVLWGDTISSNIDRYFERYILPELKSNKIGHKYSLQQKKLTFDDSNGFVDFRSADRPENWEGFGYKKIFLNEAGIILKNDYLYTNAVLPMLIDYSESVLIAGGVPKGKKKKNGTEHQFYTLYKAATNNQEGFCHFSYTSYDNPKLKGNDINILRNEIARMSKQMELQEIYGEFVEGVEGTLWEPGLIRYADILPAMKRIVVPVDPAITAKNTSDETGIVLCGLGVDDNIYVLDDLSGKYSPNKWANIAVRAYNQRGADTIVAEVNQGGDMVESVIKNVSDFTRVKKIHAYKSKYLRAEPVLGLYEQARVYHVKGLNKLENEMLTWIPGQGKSPNRIDSVVYGITELMGHDNFDEAVQF
jgi:hypothetical protein